MTPAAFAAGYHGGRVVGSLQADLEAALVLAGPVNRILVGLDFHLQPVEARQQTLLLLGQFADMLSFVLAHRRFQLIQPAFGPIELCLDEVGCTADLVLANAVAFRDVETRQLIRHPGGHIRVGGHIGDAKRSRLIAQPPALDANSQVAAELIHGFRSHLGPRTRTEQPQIGDQRLEAGGAEDVAIDGGQPVRKAVVDHGGDIPFRDLRRVDADQDIGKIDGRHTRNYVIGRHRSCDPDQAGVPLALPQRPHDREWRELGACCKNFVGVHIR